MIPYDCGMKDGTMATENRTRTTEAWFNDTGYTENPGSSEKGRKKYPGLILSKRRKSGTMPEQESKKVGTDIWRGPRIFWLPFFETKKYGFYMLKTCLLVPTAGLGLDRIHISCSVSFFFFFLLLSLKKRRVLKRRGRRSQFVK